MNSSNIKSHHVFKLFVRDLSNTSAFIVKSKIFKNVKYGFLWHHFDTSPDDL